MRHGEPIPPKVREFIIDTKSKAPRLPYGRIASMVEAEYGVTIDKSSVGREWRKAGHLHHDRTDPGLDASSDDRELGPHERSLLYFGQRLRDRLNLPDPGHAGSSLSGRGGKGAMWCGVSTWIDGPSPRDAEEEQVERDWGYGETDARQHPLFRLLEQHAEGRSCWDLLAKVDEAADAYSKACRAAYRAVLKKVSSGLPQIACHDAESLAMSLLVDGWHRARGSPGINFDYRPRKTVEGGGWFLQLGAWGIGNEGSPQALEPVSDLHSSLSTGIPEWKLVSALVKAEVAAENAIVAFRQSLNPDDRLRKLIRVGHCELCP
jgi:hypothetical protein